MTLDFDDVITYHRSRLGTYARISDYAGFKWTNFDVTTGAGAGYLTGVVSPRNDLFNRDGKNAAIVDATNFTFESGWFTAAFTNGLNVTVTGYDDGVLKYSQTITLSNTVAQQFAFDFTDIDKLAFSAGGHDWFVGDDLVFTRLPGTITGTVINDLDHDGTSDAGEPGIQRRTVILDDNGNGVVDDGEVTATTNVDGVYRFTQVSPGSHQVTEVLPNHWASTYSQVAYVQVDSGTVGQADLLQVDLRTYTGDVSGTLFDDFDRNGVRDGREPTLAGWTVWVDYDGDGVYEGGPFGSTDANGHYLLVGVAPGDAVIRAYAPDSSWEDWQPALAPATVTVGEVTRGVDLAATGAASNGDDRIVAHGRSDDTIAALDGNDRVIARGGSDRVDGGAGNDVLSGGYGDDVLFGGVGQDHLIGGVGADMFQIDGDGMDRIADFATGDHIRITADGIDDFGDLTITARGDGSVVGWAGVDGAVFVRGVAPDALEASAFVFG